MGIAHPPSARRAAGGLLRAAGLALLLAAAVAPGDGSRDAASAAPLGPEAVLARQSAAPDAFGYTFRDAEVDPTLVSRWHDACATGTVVALGDDAFATTSFPFPFKYYGDEANGANIRIASNGFVRFGSMAGATNPDNVGIPDGTPPNRSVFPFWDDLDPTNAVGIADITPQICYQAVGTAPNRRFVVQWSQIPFSPAPDHVSGMPGTPDDGHVTFQVQFEEGGRIRFEYREPGDCVATDCARAFGESATIGIESDVGLGPTGQEYSHDEPVLEAKKDGGVIPVIVFDPPQLSISKDCYAAESPLQNPAPGSHNDLVIAGTQWVCEIRVANPGAFPLSGVSITDTLPAGVIYTADTLAPPAMCVPGPVQPGGQTIACGAFTVPAGGSFRFRLGLVIDPSFVADRPCGEASICNTVGIMSPMVGDLDDGAQECDLVKDRADLAIAKTASAGTVQAGQTFTYTIHVDNLGPSDARGVQILDDLVAGGGITLVGTPVSNRPATCNVTPPQIACDLTDPLPAGERWTVVVAFTSDDAQTVTNKASVMTGGDACDGTPDPNPNNNMTMTMIEITETADLSISKDCVATADAGAAGDYSCVITVSNAGPSDATNVTVTDRLPWGITLTSITGDIGLGSCTTGTPGNPLDPMVCGLGTLEADDSATFTIVGTVGPGVPDGTILENDVRIGSDAFDPDNDDNRASDLTEVVATSNLSFTKVDVPDPVVAGQIVTYRIDVTNLGPAHAQNVRFTDSISPADFPLLTLVGVSTGGGPDADCHVEFSASAVACDLGDLAVGQMRRIELRFRVAPNAPPGTVLDDAITGVTGDSPVTVDPGSDLTESTTVVASADLSVTKTDSPDPATPGEELTYTITVRNDGPSDVPNAVVTDVLPPDTTFVFATHAACAHAAGTVTCGPLAIPAGGQVQFQIVVAIGPDAAGPALTNAVSVTSPTVPDPDPTDNTDTERTNLDTSADLRILKFGKPDGGINAGGVLTYTLIVDNLGPSTATDVLVVDDIVASGPFTILSIDPDALGNRPAASCDTLPGPVPSGSRTIRCTLPVLEPIGPAPGQGQWRITMTLTANQPISVNNTATVDSDADDPNPGNNEATVEREIGASADLSLDKTASPNPVTAGGQATYTIAISNAGPSAAPDVVVMDQLPTGVTLVTATVNPPLTGACSISPSNKLTCNLGTIPAGVSGTITVVVAVSSSLPNGTALGNSAMVTSGAFDPDPGDNFDSVTIIVSSSADLSVGKTASSPTVVAGEDLQYTISVTNAGPSAAPNVLVMDQLPAGVTFVSAMILGGSGSCVASPSGLVTCNLGTLAAGQTVTIFLDVAVDPSVPAGTILSNTVIVTSSVPDPDPEDNEPPPTEVEVVTEADLALRKRALQQGSLIVYTIDVFNLGPSDAEGVVVTDVLPAGVTYSYDTDSCVQGPPGTLTCPLGTIPAGGTASFDIGVTVDPDADGPLINTAVVTATTPDPDPSNNDDTSSTDAAPLADLRILKFGKPDDEVRAGGVVTYTVIVDNLGPSTAVGVTVQDVLASDGSFTVLSITGAACPPGPGTYQGVVQFDCTLPNLLPGARHVITFVVEPLAGASLNNVATVRALTADPDFTNNHATTEHDIDEVADIAVDKTATPSPATAGDLVTYTIVVTNNGPNVATGVSIVDRLPAGVTVESITTADGTCTVGTPGNPIDPLQCSFGTLDVGETATVTFQGRISPNLPAGTVLKNDVVAYSDLYDTDPTNNRDSTLTPLAAGFDLVLDKTYDGAPRTVGAGEDLTYLLRVRNLGPSAAPDVEVVDDLPAGVTFVSATVLDGAGNLMGGTDCALEPAENRLTCRVGDLAAGKELLILIRTTVDPAFDCGAGSLLNIAYVRSATAPTGDPTPDDPDEGTGGTTVETSVSCGTGLRILKTAIAPIPAIPGEPLRYQLLVTNLGPATAFDVVVTDPLAPELSYLYSTSAGCVAGPPVTCSLGDLSPGQTVVFDLVVLVDPAADSGIANTATATWEDASGEPAGEVSDDELVPVSPVADLRVAKYGKPDNGVQAGERLTYTILVQNLGPSVAADVVLQDVLTSEGVLEVVALDPGGICATLAPNPAPGTPIGPGDTVFTCTIDALDPFELVLVNLVFTATEAGSVNNTAIVSSSAYDPDESNNTAHVRHEFEDVADLEVIKTADPAGSVGAGGRITYTITVTNTGPSRAENVEILDRLPPGVTVVGFDAGGGSCVTGTAGSVADRMVCGLGGLDPGESRVVTVFVQVDPDLEDGTILENDVTVIGETYDPDNRNDRSTTLTPVVGDGGGPGIRLRKTVSLTGACPGRDVQLNIGPGQPILYCIEIVNEGTGTLLAGARITDTVVTRLGASAAFTEVFAAPLLPGATREISYTRQYMDMECGPVVNTVRLTGGYAFGMVEMPGPAFAPDQAAPLPIDLSDSARVRVTCTDGAVGADPRVSLPILGGPPAAVCESWIQIQNLGCEPTKAVVVLWGAAGACPPQAAGPLKLECTGLLRPGSAWSMPSSLLPAGMRSGIVYAMNAEAHIRTPQGNELPFADAACRYLFDYLVGSDLQWIQFDEAYRLGGTYVGPMGQNGEQLALDFGRYPGQPVAVTVNHSCPDPTDPSRFNHGGYHGIPTGGTGVYDPQFGGYTFYAPLVFSDKGGLNTALSVQNLGIECTSLEIYFAGQDNCLRPILGDILAVAPGETVTFDPSTVLGTDWIGSAWVRASQALGVAVATQGSNHLTIYNGLPGNVYSSADFSLGAQVNYAPLIYSEYQGWDTALVVQNLSGIHAAKAKVYFLDRSGDIITTLVDWICPRGSQTFFLPVIESIPGNWIGSARSESQEWWSPGQAAVDPPRLQTVALLERWSDPARTERREAIAYNALTEAIAYDWQIGIGKSGGVTSGSAVIGIPLLAKANRGITSELAVTNLVPKPGFTDFAIFFYDQNGLLDVYCQKLGDRQSEYIDLNVQGIIPRNYLGSAVISAVFWEHEVFDAGGGFERNLVGLSAVIVERIGGTQGGPDVPGDESKGFEGVPISAPYCEPAPLCPGVRSQ